MQQRLRGLAVPGLAIVLAAVLPAGVTAGEGKRLERALSWPVVDLSAYDKLFIEDCRITDPAAAERKIQDLLETAPKRMADYIAFSVDREAYRGVERRPARPGESGLIVRVELPQYKPGSASARFAVGMGAGSAHLDVTVHLLDAGTGSELVSFTEERDFGWGGVYGGSRGITLMEEKAAKEIAAYLSLRKGIEESVVLSRMKVADEVEPPEVAHGVIYVMRPQGFVGGAARFRVGIDDVTLGESKRNSYHLVYAPPGQHKLWWGQDKRQKATPLLVEAGKTYYFEAMGMKQIPAKKGENNLGECELLRTIDLTHN